MLILIGGIVNTNILSGCHRLVVLRGESPSRGRGFESQHQIMEGHFFTFEKCCKKIVFVLKKTDNKQKESG